MEQANEIANAMKEWAIAKGATYYTHWFQPMTGLTAEKHDSFISITGPGKVIEKFSGIKTHSGGARCLKLFLQGGSALPLRHAAILHGTLQARLLSLRAKLGKTLCIPTIFISYHGEALDKKLPLLRSDDALNKAAVRPLKAFWP